MSARRGFELSLRRSNWTYRRMGPAVRIPSAPATRHCEPQVRVAFLEDGSELSESSPLRYMDESGIWAQIVYPNFLGFGGQRATQLPEDEATL